MLEGSQAVAEAVILRRLASLALQATQALVELVHLGATWDDGPGVDDAQTRVFGEVGFAGREIGAPRGELGLSTRERLLRLMEGGDPLLDVCEALLGSLGGGGRASREVRLHTQECLLASSEFPLAPVQLLCVRREADLGVLDRVVVASRTPARPLIHARNRVGELALAVLHRGDALGQLTAEAAELLLGGDADRVQALLLALDRNGLVLLPAE